MEKKKPFNSIFKLVAGTAVALSFFLFSANALAASVQVSTLPPTSVTQTSMTFQGDFTGATGTVQMRFDYGTTPSLGSFTSYQSFTNASGQFSQNMTGLSAGTTYYYQAEGIGMGGPGFGSTITDSTSSYQTATVQTLPIANPSTDVTSTTALLQGFFNGNGATTSTFFEYANNSSFVGEYTTSPVIQSGTSGSFSATITGLQPSTTYYYRADATTGSGTAVAQTVIAFTTLASGGGSSSCAINSFYASPTTVSSGGTTQIVWSTSNCGSVSVTGGGISSNQTSGSVTSAALYGTTTFYITAGSQTNQTTVTVNGGGSGSCAINSFYATPTSVYSGGTTEIIWSTSNCNNVSVTGGGVSSNQNSGSVSSTSLYGTTTFTITADGQTQSTSVSINGGSGGTQCQVSSFYASPSFVNSGDSVTLYWTMSNCNYVTISGPGLSGGSYYGSSVTTSPIYTGGTYYLTGYGTSGGTTSANTTVSLNTIPINGGGNYYGECQITSFYASPAQVSAGNATMLYWNTTGCTSVSISGGSLSSNNTQLLSGSVLTGALYGPTNYTITAYGGNNGSQTQQTTVTTIPTNIFNGGGTVTPTYTPPTYTPPATIIRYVRYITGGSPNPTSSGAGVVLGSTVEANNTGSIAENNLAGLALWGGSIFPTSMVGILFIILLIMVIIIVARNISNANRQHIQQQARH